jgi:hypothetical protein
MFVLDNQITEIDPYRLFFEIIAIADVDIVAMAICSIV